MGKATIIDGSDAWDADDRRPVVTIGNFDGVHRGHRALLDRTLALAASLDAVPTAFTFHPAPRDVLRPGNPIPRIQTLEERLRLLGDHGMERIVVEPFTLDYAAHDAEWFARVVLGERLRAAAVVVGWDFRFGKGRGGSIDTLRDALDIPVEQVQALVDGEEPVSSSRIRRLIGEGEVGAATALLDRPHELLGVVVHGDARGRLLGFPTANIESRTELVPASGVYAVQMLIPGEAHALPGVANIGTRPTFDGPDDTRVEVHLLDYAGDLYNQRVRVRFIGRLRAEQRFPSREALVAQIGQDVARARAVLGLDPNA